MKVGVFGIGAIGSLLVKYLNQNKENRYFYFSKSKKDTVTINYQGSQDRFPIKLCTQLSLNLDWLIICLKEYHVAEALPSIRTLISSTTQLAIFQNGIDLASPYTTYTKASSILETLIDCPVQRIETDQYVQLKNPQLILPQSSLAEDFAHLFSGTEIDITLSTKFLERQWIKLIESASLGSLQAYTGQSCSIFKQTEYLNEYSALIAEGIQVAKSEGIALESDLKEKLIRKLLAYPAHKGSSMLSDKMSGNKIELEAKTGAILKIATKNKIEVPRTQRIYTLLVNNQASSMEQNWG